MALDGIVIANIVKDMREKLVGGRILKIQQPEKDELIITIKNYDQYRLFISADASLPLIYLASSKKEAPMTAPNFCMLLRKYIGTARIVNIYQPEFERIIVFDLEHLDEMGDLCRKKLIVEIMGKHSNIIFCDDENMIVDSIKHISAAVSSVREVLPGREYFIPKTQEKLDPTAVSEELFREKVCGYPGSLTKAVYMNLTGFSPVMANELIFRAGLNGEMNAAELTGDLVTHFYKCFERFMEEINSGSFVPCIVYKGADAEGNGKEPVEFASLLLSVYEQQEGMKLSGFESISAVLEEYYAKKNLMTRMKQKSTDLRHLVGNAMERAVKKYDIQKKQLEDTLKRDKYKLYGELLTTYGYGIEPGVKQAVVNNYYTGEDISIALDEQLSAIENAKKYYEKYSKLKRTFEAVSEQIVQTEEEMEHLDSIKVALDIASCDEDLNTIKNELVEFGYIKGHFGRLSVKGAGVKGSKGRNGSYVGGNREKSKPLHYVTGDGFHIYVGKNNYQNDELTFKMANGGDWWFHAKKNAGSHVIVKTEGRELPDRVYEQAAALAAYYSKSKDGQKVDVDYLERKNVKKPNGAKPGFVIYYTNYSMTVTPGLDGLTQL
ncbi:MAG: NFACT family protein [Lachnospiraceae bacterium]|nr:NFACT family protein [Lachnospiraceae bacterium]